MLFTDAHANAALAARFGSAPRRPAWYRAALLRGVTDQQGTGAVEAAGAGYESPVIPNDNTGWTDADHRAVAAVERLSFGVPTAAGWGGPGGHVGVFDDLGELVCLMALAGDGWSDDEGVEAYIPPGALVIEFPASLDAA